MNNLSVSMLRKSLFGAALAIAASASTSSANAQQQLNVTVPFAFQNGAQHLPAGTYVVTLDASQVIGLRGLTAGGFSVTRPASRLQPLDRGKIVFRRYGNRYFLHELWVAGSTSGREIPTSRAEKETQSMASLSAPSNVELAVNNPIR